MIIFIVLIVMHFIFSIQKRTDDSAILCKYDTTVINGLCTLFIFFSHATQYWPLANGILDQSYQHVQNIHNQWVVAPFLAFSGYGVMISIVGKGQKYLDTYPRNRLLRTLLSFDIAVCLYLILSFILGTKYSTLTIIGSFIGLTSVGNYNWYIWAILVMYICSYVAAIIFDDRIKQIMLLFGFSILYIVIMYYLGFEERFYSTIICYPFGAFLAVINKRIISVIKEKPKMSVCICSFLIASTYKLRYNFVVMNFSSVVLLCLIVWFMCFFCVKSKILYFFGEHAFSIFILQRIPGIILVNCFL